MMELYRGDIVYIGKGLRAVGTEMYSERPAVVVSNDKCNKNSTIIEVVYLTSQPKRNLPTHVNVLCNVPSIALCEAVYSIDRNRVTGYIRSASDAEMREIDKALNISLGLTDKMPESVDYKAERDLYKNLYEQLLEKVVGR